MHPGRRKDFFILMFSLVNYILAYDLQNFDDTVLFKINWPGKSAGDLLVSAIFQFLLWEFNLKIILSSRNLLRS